MKAMTKTSLKRKILFLICSCHCYKSILSDTRKLDEFKDRHRREPKEQNTIFRPRFPTLQPTIDPINDPCTTENVEIIGSYTKVNIPYKYEISIESEYEPELANEIIPAIERDISVSVLSFLFDSCDETTQIQKRQLKKQIKNQHNHRSLQLQRIISSPLDIIDPSAFCSILEVSNDESTCYLIKGGLTLFFDEKSTEDDIKASKDETYDILKVNMVTIESYAQVHQGIIKMVLVLDDLPTFKTIETPGIVTFEPISFPKRLSFILIGSISGTLILLSFCIKEKNERSIRHINDDFEVEITSCITDQHSYDHIHDNPHLQDEYHTNFNSPLSESSSGSDFTNLVSDGSGTPGLGASSPSTPEQDNDLDDNPLLSFFGLTTLLFQNPDDNKKASSKGSLDAFASD